MWKHYYVRELSQFNNSVLHKSLPSINSIFCWSIEEVVCFNDKTNFYVKSHSVWKHYYVRKLSHLNNSVLHKRLPFINSVALLVNWSSLNRIYNFWRQKMQNELNCVACDNVLFDTEHHSIYNLQFPLNIVYKLKSNSSFR